MFFVKYRESKKTMCKKELMTQVQVDIIIYSFSGRSVHLGIHSQFILKKILYHSMVLRYRSLHTESLQSWFILSNGQNGQFGNIRASYLLFPLCLLKLCRSKKSR